MNQLTLRRIARRAIRAYNASKANPFANALAVANRLDALVVKFISKGKGRDETANEIYSSSDFQGLIDASQEFKRAVSRLPRNPYQRDMQESAESIVRRATELYQDANSTSAWRIAGFAGMIGMKLSTPLQDLEDLSSDSFSPDYDE